MSQKSITLEGKRYTAKQILSGAVRFNDEYDEFGECLVHPVTDMDDQGVWQPGTWTACLKEMATGVKVIDHNHGRCVVVEIV